jgi:hypothetical protein
LNARIADPPAAPAILGVAEGVFALVMALFGQKPAQKSGLFATGIL